MRFICVMPDAEARAIFRAAMASFLPVVDARRRLARRFVSRLAVGKAVSMV